MKRLLTVASLVAIIGFAVAGCAEAHGDKKTKPPKTLREAIERIHEHRESIEGLLEKRDLKKVHAQAEEIADIAWNCMQEEWEFNRRAGFGPRPAGRAGGSCQPGARPPRSARSRRPC